MGDSLNVCRATTEAQSVSSLTTIHRLPYLKTITGYSLNDCIAAAHVHMGVRINGVPDHYVCASKNKTTSMKPPSGLEVPPSPELYGLSSPQETPRRSDLAVKCSSAGTDRRKPGKLRLVLTNTGGMLGH